MCCAPCQCCVPIHRHRPAPGLPAEQSNRGSNTPPTWLPAAVTRASNLLAVVRIEEWPHACQHLFICLQVATGGEFVELDPTNMQPLSRFTHKDMSSDFKVGAALSQDAL